MRFSRFRGVAVARTEGGAGVPYWDVIGQAVVTDEYVRLTPDRQNKKGAIWNNKVGRPLRRMSTLH